MPFKKKWKAAIRWSWYQRCIDAAIIAGIVIAIYFGYAGHFWIFAGLLSVVVILASFRFYQPQNPEAAASGEIDGPDFADPSSGADVGDADAGGGDD